MEVVISITGTSLLTKLLDSCMRQGYPNSLQQCFDQEKWGKIDQYDMQSVLSVICEDAQNDLESFLSQAVENAYPEKASAETNSLRMLMDELMETHNLRSLDKLRLKLYFIASNTTSGRACAKALCQYFKNEYPSFDVEKPIVIEQLTGDPFTFEKGISELTDEIIKTIAKEKSQGNEVSLNATGGFKPEAAYATLCGLINDVNVFYAHEYFGDKIVWLPSFPLGFDFDPWHLSSYRIQYALSGNKSAYDNLPHQIQKLMGWDQKSSAGRFNPLGNILWTSYQAVYAKHRLSAPKELLTDRIKDPDLRSKILGFINGWDNLWVGQKLPWMLDHSQTHCQNLLMLAEQLLLPMDNLLSDEELYVLIACLWLHDIGHSESNEIKEDGTKEALSLQQIQKKHASLAYQAIEHRPNDFGFPEFNDEAKLIAEICRDHKNDKLGCIPEECELKIYDNEGATVFRQATIRRRLITALLQFIDTCDFGGPRAGSEDYVRARLQVTEGEIENLKKRLKIATDNNEIEYQQFLEEQLDSRKDSEYHFRLHQEIAEVEIKPEKRDNKWNVEIIIHPREEGTNVTKLVSGDPMNVEEDIGRIKPFLEPYITDVVIKQGTAIS